MLTADDIRHGERIVVIAEEGKAKNKLVFKTIYTKRYPKGRP